MLDLVLARCVREAGGCLAWTGPHVRGYGRATYQGRLRIVTRLVWELTHGEIPAGLVVAHTCDNPKCCNIAHLYLCTQRENMRDRGAKGRTHVKFSQALIDEVRALRRAGGLLQAIADQTGVSKAHVRQVCKGNYRA